MKNVLRNINILNFMLLTVLAMLFFSLVYPLLNVDMSVTIPKARALPAKQEEKVTAENMATMLDYVIINERNLFHPSRKMPTEQEEDRQVIRPEIIFYGAVITPEKKMPTLKTGKSLYDTGTGAKAEAPYRRRDNRRLYAQGSASRIHCSGPRRG